MPAARPRQFDANTHEWLRIQLKPDQADAGRIPSAQIETGVVCNLSCPFCGTGNETIPLDKEFLSADKFSAILERLGPALKVVVLARMGEPLLNPEIFDMISRASRKGLITIVHSNLSLPAFDDAAARALVSSGLTDLSVSCDGASQGTYQQYRVGGNFELVMRNIETLTAAKNRASSPLPKITWQFLVHGGNQHEMESARSMARRLGVEILFKKLAVPRIPRPEDRWALNPDVERTLDLEPRFPTCLMTWDQPSVHSDGTVFPCCAVTDPRYSLGNILQESMAEIWNKPLAVAMRRYLKSGGKVEAALPCYACPWNPHGGALR